MEETKTSSYNTEEQSTSVVCGGGVLNPAWGCWDGLPRRGDIRKILKDEWKPDGRQGWRRAPGKECREASGGGGGESACPVKQGESGVARTRLVVRNKAGEFNGAHPHRDLYEFPQGTYF